MSQELDAAAERELQRLHASWMADARLRVELDGKYADVYCRHCGARLTYGIGELACRGLAIRNATRNPCCEAWT